MQELIKSLPNPSKGGAFVGRHCERSESDSCPKGLRNSVIQSEAKKLFAKCKIDVSYLDMTARTILKMPKENMKSEITNYQLILNKLESRASLKQEIYRNTVDVFAVAKKALSKLASRLHQDYTQKDPSVEVAYKDTHQFEAELKFSGDMLLLSMHSNIFNFEEGHRIYSSSYVKSNPCLSYCGVIYIHNFLADSIKYNRLADEGTLIARILINKEKRFIVEGEGQLGFLYESFSEHEINEEVLTHIFELTVLDCIDTDLQLPPYVSVKDITLHQKQTTLAASGYPTGKRLGYLFKSEVQQNNNL